MDQLVQCPVCTLFLHNGMSLESHLDTHPKDQVIKALCSLSSTKTSTYGSRTSTPVHSERSYRSRSRTPATEDTMRWNSPHRSSQDWRRTPSRTSKATHSATISRMGTPDINFENSSFSNAQPFPGPQFPMKSDKMQQTYIDGAPIDMDQQYLYYNDQSDERELKYSKSADYTAIENPNNALAYNIPLVGPGVKLQTTLVPRKHNDFVKILPKPNNIVMKSNQYMGSGVKPLHVMMPTTPTFVQKNVHNNMILAGSVPTTQILDTKSVAPIVAPTQFNQMSSATLTPGTTVVTQNSQIIFREMVHNLEGKPFLPNMSGVIGSQENISNVTQSSSLYQNVMLLDQFGNASCMYTTPPPLLQKPYPPPIYSDNCHLASPVNKSAANIMSDTNKTLIIEVGPIKPSAAGNVENSVSHSLTPQPEPSTSKCNVSDLSPGRTDGKADTPGPNKGLKILSNIKVEVPVQHHKNMLNTVMDLTGPNESDYPIRPLSPEKILPDLDDTSITDDCTQPSTMSGDSQVSQTFSVIKNIGNPPTYKESTSKSNSIDNKVENELSDSCPVPDLICNEKPSISPCSELSEHGDNATDHSAIVNSSTSSVFTHSPLSCSAKTTKSVSPIPRGSKINESKRRSSGDAKNVSTVAPKTFKNNPLILNNLYVKKHKKILQIKNAKMPATTLPKTEPEPVPSSSKCRSPENFTMNKLNQRDKSNDSLNTLQTVSIEKIKEIDHEGHHEFDADTEEQSMDIEPIAPSTLNSSNEFTTSLVQIKEEINTSNEGGFSNEAGTSACNLTTLEGLRPINVITYGNMAPEVFDDDDSNHRELLELEASSKNKQFVNMMNDNYFGDNIYADYFTPDREEAFDAVRESTGFCKDVPKDVWMKESEFVLPNFIHESYKIAESNVDYGDMDNRDCVQDVDAERDNKADVLSESRSDGEPPLNIRADERMPPRGELSGQESNGDMDSSWSGIYNEVTPSEPYDLIARESWVSDGSEVDAAEKRENLNEDLQFPTRRYSCTLCAGKFGSLKELRSHKSLAHPLATGSGVKTTYSRLVTARTIKKEEKPDENMLQGTLLLPPDSKEAIAKTMLQVYDAMADAKPKLEALIKQEPKRRRKDYVCPTCKEDQGTDVAFHAHLKLHPLECLTCGKCFFRRANLALHIKTHLGIKNYKCDVCGKAFITRQKLSEHHNTHTGRAPIKCTLCDDTFRRYSNMVQHRDRAHLNKKAKVRDYVCHCGAVFHSKAKLFWHKECHEERPKACPYCSDKFVHAASLTRHMRRSHNQHFLSAHPRGKNDNVQCPVCKQVYLRSNLRAHLVTHSGKKPHACVICNKSFTTKWNLKLHRWTHMSRSAKPFKCSLCKGAFIRQTEYISHMNAHKSVRPYTCNYCGCQFIRKYNCQRHVREHEMAKKYTCKVPDCGKSFHRSYYLSEHMKVHSGARPFSCNICGKTSSNKSNHNKHIKIHHAREPVATEA